MQRICNVSFLCEGGVFCQLYDTKYILIFISNRQIAYVLVCCGVEYVDGCVVASFVVLPSFENE